MEYNVYSAMQTGDPLALYKKEIVGKVHVVALNPFTDKPERVILEGNKEESYIEVWTDKGVAFFERINKEHINAGRLAKTEKRVKAEKSPNIVTDEEIDELLNSKFLKLKHRAEKFTDTAPLLRLINRARELEKSEKIIAFLESTSSAIELAKYED